MSKQPLEFPSGTARQVTAVGVAFDGKQLAAQPRCLWKFVPGQFDGAEVNTNGQSLRSDEFVELLENLIAHGRHASTISKAVDLYESGVDLVCSLGLGF